jgi:hypothetical protein
MIRKIKPLQGAKRKAWKAFSDYIRLRDSLKTTGTPDYCKCITCGKVVPYEQIQCGHAIGGRTSGFLFDEELCRGQCRSCNVDHGGEYQMFKYKLVQKHGEAWWAMKEQAKRTSAQYTEFDYELIAGKYRDMVKALKAENNL